MQKHREETGESIIGVATGLPSLDEILGGLRTGLAVLAGGPGRGKTTLATQIAVHVARSGTPAVYVSYENSPRNLLLKIICATAGLSTTDVERGTADLARLREAAARLGPALDRLAIVEGDSRLRVARIRSLVRPVVAKGAGRCLLVCDYLQRAAQGLGFEQLRHNVTALAGELRDLATEFDSPVLAISSQNRDAGGYGRGRGSASLDSLKESGDLEYGADAVLFLVQTDRPADPPARALDLVVSKNRYGASETVVPLIFRPDRGEMREVSRRGR